LYHEDKKDGLTIWQRAYDGLNCMKAQAIHTRSPKQIFKVLGDDSYRKQYDVNYDEGRMIERIADQIFLVTQKTKKVSIVAARDFVMTIYSYISANGTIYGIAFENDIPNLVPEVKGVIRARAPIGGWRLEPIEGGKTRVSYLVELDLKGNIPGFVIKQANKDGGYQLVKLRAVVEKYI
jgi:START domain